MWEAWTRNGGSNPTSPSRAGNRFVIADPWRRRMSVALKDCYDIGALGYSYDVLQQMPVVTASASAVTASSEGALRPRPASRSIERIARADAAQLRATPVQVELTRKGGRPGNPAGPDRERSPRLSGAQRPACLGAAGRAVPPVLGWEPGLGRLDPRDLAGSIHFFDAEFHDRGGGTADEALGKNFYSCDVSGLLQSIARQDASPTRRALYVTIVPGGVPSSRAEPVVARIELMFQ